MKTIKQVKETAEKLSEFIESTFEGIGFAQGLGVDPATGRFTIEIRLYTPEFTNAFPADVDGIKVNVIVMDIPTAR